MSNRKPKAKVEEPAPTRIPTAVAAPAPPPPAHTTLATPATASVTPLAFLRSIRSADAVPHHLVFTTLALLLASGLIARRLHSKNRYRAPSGTPKGSKKRKQDVVKSILLAQGQDEGANAAGPAKSRSRSSSTVTPSVASPQGLLPSPVCITSTSAAIWNNLEKIGAVLNPSKSGAKGSAPRTTVARKESSTQTMPDVAKVGKEVATSAKDAGSSLKKGKNKKGKGVALAPTPSTSKGSSSEMTRASSTQESKTSGGDAPKTDHGVQVSPDEAHGTAPTSTLRSQHEFPVTSNPAEPLPPPSSPGPPSRITASASVQTSPRLLPYRPRTPSPTPPPSSSDTLLTHSTPASKRPKPVPIPFDLHASFQATPPSILDEEGTPSTSPSLSSSPSQSPSLSASTSSGSPTGRRRSSVSTPLPSGNGPKSRKQTRRAAPAGLNGQTVVGLPKPMQTAEEAEADTRGREGAEKTDDDHDASTVGRTSANGRARPAPIPIPANSARPHANDSTPQPQRRLSTASSSAYSASNLSLTSSGSPYSTTERVLPMMPPAMTMTPPDFARRSSSTVAYDRDETLRWTSASSAGGRAREASLRGLGVDLDRGESEDSSVDGTDARSRAGGSVREPSPTSNGYFQPPLGRTSSYATPDSSPHPVHRTIAPFGTPSPSFPPSHQPWSSHTSATSAQNASLVPYPIASSSSNSTGPIVSRPPSRQSSLSVPLNASQQQQLHLQQQQQAYAIAQVQAQAAAQYQHVVALQYQAQIQMQQQQQPHRGDDTRQRRRAADGGSGKEEMSQTPNGLVYPLNSAGQPHSQNWPSATPMSNAYPAHLAQAVSPTSTTFSSNTISPHTQAQMYQSYINQSAAYYLAAANSSSPHSSPIHQQQHPQRPRISSSVSAVAVLGGGSGGNAGARNGATGSPASTSSITSPRVNGGEKQRSGSSNSFSPLGAGVGSGAVTANDASAWKARAKEAEMEADRNAKELEIARWRLSVLEGEQLANESENQEALRALATRAMRAEARIKLLEETRKSDTQSHPLAIAFEASPSPFPGGASPVASKPLDLPVPGTSATSGEASWKAFAEDSQAVNGGPGSGLHPLSWLDLDSISFSTRPLNPPRPQLTSSHSSSSSHRKRAGRNSHGSGSGNTRRQSGNHTGRRKSSNNHLLSPSLHLSVPSPSESSNTSPTRGNDDAGDAQDEEEDEDEIVIVLNASKRPTRSPSRRSSYATSNAGGGVGDASSYIDEDDIPTIEFDSDSRTTSRVPLVPPPPHQLYGGTPFSDAQSQNGSVCDDGDDEPVDYVGFLPRSLSKAMAASAGRKVEHAIEEANDNNGGEESFDMTTPEAQMPNPRSEDGEGDGEVEGRAAAAATRAVGAEPILELALGVPHLVESTRPRSPSYLDQVDAPRSGWEKQTKPSPHTSRGLFHPVPIRPSQIALPPSP